MSTNVNIVLYIMNFISKFLLGTNESDWLIGAIILNLLIYFRFHVIVQTDNEIIVFILVYKLCNRESIKTNIGKNM